MPMPVPDYYQRHKLINTRTHTHTSTNCAGCAFPASGVARTRAEAGEEGRASPKEMHMQMRSTLWFCRVRVEAEMETGALEEAEDS